MSECFIDPIPKVDQKTLGSVDCGADGFMIQLGSLTMPHISYDQSPG